MTALTVSYAIARATPAPTDPPASDRVSFAVDSSSRSAHLASLETALGDARTNMNDRLTEWKHALKDVEKLQKPKKGEKGAQDEDLDEEEDDLDDAE
ncbi:hypothetical protein JCM3774_005757 [Rhodotorula dairenensis]